MILVSVIFLSLVSFLPGFEKEVYAVESSFEKNDAVIISNESLDYSKQESSGTFSIGQVNSTTSNDIKFLKGAYKLDKVLEFSPEKYKASLINGNAKDQKQLNKVGSLKGFWVVNMETNKDYLIQAKLKYSSAHAEIWVHNDEITPTQAKRMGDEFDQTIYPLITENFSSSSDVDGNDKVAILIYDIKDGFSGAGGYFAGYFYSRDLYNTSYSNLGEVFYIDTYPAMGMSRSTYDVSKAFGTIAHEFQHMVNYNQNVLVEGGDYMDTWLDEALSMAAEQMYEGFPLIDRIGYYEQSASIANGHSLLYWDDYGDVYSNYSLSYLFGQYLRIQADQGEKIFKEILQDPSNIETSLQNIIHRYIDPTKSLGEFITDFRHALYVNDPTGLYGFESEAIFSEIESPLFTGGLPRTLRGGGGFNLSIKDAKIFVAPKDKGSNITYRLIDVTQKTNRINGKDRYETAVSISQNGWDTSKTVILASGLDFPDALVGGPLAYKENAPILLTGPKTLHTVTKAEISRLQAKNIIILGGTGVVSSAVEKELRGLNIQVERIGGENRFHTAALIAKRLPSEKAVVAYGYDFPDVLSVSPYVAKNGIPILLSQINTMPAETLNALSGKKQTIVVGSTGVISDSVKNKLPGAVRYGGKTRYDTAKEINLKLPMGTQKAFVTTGKNFPDALAGSVLAAKNDAPILLVTDTLIPAPTMDLISKYESISILGSVGAVGESVQQELENILSK